MATLAVLIKDRDDKTLGGLWGRTGFGWLFVELLFVPEGLRGQGLGAGLLSAAEVAARARGCHSAWLDTYDFQAPGFYQKLGYMEFGVLDDYPVGHKRRFLRKSLA